MPYQIRIKNQDGVSMVEFLIGFPLFLLSTLLVLEIAYMSADSHLVELAAFDAARTMSSEQYDSNPCGPEALRAANETVTRRLAATNMSIDQMSVMIDQPDLGKNFLVLIKTGNFKKVVETNLRRLPMSEVSNRVRCTYDNINDNLTVEIDYYRSPKFPIVGKTLFQLFSLAEFLESGNGVQGMVKYLEELSNTPVLDGSSLFIPYTLLDDPAKFVQLQLEYGKVVNEWKMKTREIISKLTSQLNEGATDEEKIEYLVSNLPDPYKKIPINTKITLKRKINNANPTLDMNGLKRNAWHGKIEGLINIEGTFNNWAKDLSIEKDMDLNEGVRL
jgi:hypothetical protein